MEKTIKLATVRSTLGLLTTVHQLPTNYQVQYIKFKAESPLDLTIKPFNEQLVSTMTPPTTPNPLKKRYREIENEHFTIIVDEQNQTEMKILSPLKKRFRQEDLQETKPILTPQQIKQETTPKKSTLNCFSQRKKLKKSTSTAKRTKVKGYQKIEV